MQAKVLNEAPERTCALVLQTGEEVVAALEGFAQEHGLAATRITAIGALQRAVVGYFDWQRKDYERIAVNEQVEVLSLIGDVALADGRPKLHAHVVLGRRDGPEPPFLQRSRSERPVRNDRERGLRLPRLVRDACRRRGVRNGLGTNSAAGACRSVFRPTTA